MSANILLAGRTIAPNQTLQVKHRLFVGAKQVSLLDAYAEKEEIERFDLLIDWGWVLFSYQAYVSIFGFL